MIFVLIYCQSPLGNYEDEALDFYSVDSQRLCGSDLFTKAGSRDPKDDQGDLVQKDRG